VVELTQQGSHMVCYPKEEFYRANMVLSMLPRRRNYISSHDEMSMEVWKEVEISKEAFQQASEANIDHII
jgi:DNA-binding winged helix-turn-helix (wHTH) protein